MLAQASNSTLRNWYGFYQVETCIIPDKSPSNLGPIGTTRVWTHARGIRIGSISNLVSDRYHHNYPTIPGPARDNGQSPMSWPPGVALEH